MEMIHYKPGHKLKWNFLPIHDEEAVWKQAVEIWWEFKRPDCHNPSEWGVGRSGAVTVYLPHVYTKEQLVRTIFGMTMRLEEHECREFFLYGLERPFDPHKELLQ